MAEYTVELRDVLESGVNIFDFDYGFYSEKKRPDFERNFIRHFYFREIGFQTIDRFKLEMQDIFANVFPYYNELFNSAQIEYDKLNNYNVTETQERVVNEQKKSDNVVSNRGQVFDEQKTSINQSVEDNTTTTNAESDHFEKLTESEGSRDNERKTDVTTTDDGSTSLTKKNVNKFHDTPRGELNLDNAKYLTNITQEDISESGTSENTNNVDGTVTDDENTSSKTEETADTTKDGTTTTTTTGKSDGTTEHKQEQRMLSDGNERKSEQGSQVESFKLTRVGNIGVQTGSDMVEKHINLQKTLSNIQKMFFDECECLFMGVY